MMHFPWSVEYSTSVPFKWGRSLSCTCRGNRRFTTSRIGTGSTPMFMSFPMSPERYVITSHLTWHGCRRCWNPTDTWLARWVALEPKKTTSPTTSPNLFNPKDGTWHTRELSCPRKRWGRRRRWWTRRPNLWARWVDGVTTFGRSWVYTDSGSWSTPFIDTKLGTPLYDLYVLCRVHHNARDEVKDETCEDVPVTTLTSVVLMSLPQIQAASVIVDSPTRLTLKLHLIYLSYVNCVHAMWTMCIICGWYVNYVVHLWTMWMECDMWIYRLWTMWWC
jgi:hypothetical protein